MRHTYLTKRTATPVALCMGSVFLFSFAACLGDDPILVTSSFDSGPDTPNAGDASSGEDGAIPAADIRWVTADGKVGNSGLTPREGLKSIREAILSLRTSRARRGEIRLCAGAEPHIESSIVLDYPASIRGGFDCSTGLRTSAFGKAQDFATASKILASPSDTGGTTLMVSGAAIDAGVILDGLSIGGQLSGSRIWYSVLLRNNASPTLRDNAITGSTVFPVTGVGSVALRVESGSALIASNNVYGGGANSVDSVGAIGVQLLGGTPRLQYNSIVMDGNKGVNGAWGIQLDGYAADNPLKLAGPSAVFSNEILLRNTEGEIVKPKDASDVNASPFVGINVFSPNAIEIRGNRIVSTNSICRSASCMGYAIIAGGSFDATGGKITHAATGTIEGNTIALDSVNTPSVPSPVANSTVQLRAIQVYYADNMRIANNAVAVTRGGSSNYASRYTMGLYIGNGTGIDVQHNTFHVLGGSNAAGDGFPIWVEADGALSSSVRVTNNVLSSFGGAGSGGVFYNGCDNATLSAMTGNVLIGTAALVRTHSGSRQLCSAAQEPSTMQALADTLTKSGVQAASDNRVPTDASCTGNSIDACMQKLFGDATLNSALDSWFKKGALPSNEACATMRSAAESANAPPTDLAGIARKGTSVAGAWMGACATP